MFTNPYRKRYSPVRILSTGYIILSILGALILQMPFSSASDSFTPFVDALFTSASAITTTGLVVVDTGTYYNGFGQFIILILFQVGGLGYMIFVALAVLMMGKGLSMSYRILLRESVNRPSHLNLVKFVKIIIVFTLTIELMGTIALTIFFSQHYPFMDALYSAVFHSISAFTTAGFSIYADSFVQYKGSLFLNVIIICLIISGAFGFFVLYDLYEVFFRRKNKPRNRLSTHTKLVLSVGFILNVIGVILIFFSEGTKFSEFLPERLLTATFQSLTASTTAGFNSVDIGSMSVASLYYITILMFIGAGSGGTAGGIKLTTFAVILLAIYTELSTKKSIPVFKRSIAFKTVTKAFAIAGLTLLWLLFAVLLMDITEDQEFLRSFFEVVSALGTVGLSTGITASITSFGKIILIITMLIGRIGPLAIGLSVISEDKISVKYAEDEILVG